MNYKQLMEAKELALPIPFSVTANDTCPAALFQYVPDGGDGGTAATLTYVQGGNLTVTVGGAVPAGNDAFGTSGVISCAAAAYDTIGEVVNYFNSLPAWRAKLLCRPETLMANILAQTSTSCLLDNGLALYLDTSVADTTYIWNAAITGSMFDNYGLAGSKSDVDDHCVNRFHMAQFTQDFTSAATAYLYVFKQGDTTSTKVYTKALVDATLTDMGNTTHPTQPWYEAPEGYTLCLEIRSDAATAFSTFTVLGSTIVRKNNRVVNRLAHVAA